MNAKQILEKTQKDYPESFLLFKIAFYILPELFHCISWPLYLYLVEHATTRLEPGTAEKAGLTTHGS